MPKRIRALGATEHWTVQVAYSGGIEFRTFTNETDAEAKVSELLRDWLLPNWFSVVTVAGTQQLNDELIKIVNLINFGMIWKAYDDLHDIEHTLGEISTEVPVWYRVGTIRVDGPPGKGPEKRLPLIKQADFPNTQATERLKQIQAPFVRWRYCGNSGYFKNVPEDFPRQPLTFINPIQGSIVQIMLPDQNAQLLTIHAADFTQEDVDRGVESWKKIFGATSEMASQTVSQWVELGNLPDPLKKLIGLDAESRNALLTFLLEAIRNQPTADAKERSFPGIDPDTVVKEALELMGVSEC